MTASLPEYVAGCYSNNPLNSLKWIRQLSSLPAQTCIQPIINSKVVPQIIKILKNNNGEVICNGFLRKLQIEYIVPIEIIRLCIIYGIDDELQSECIWIITNITAGNSIQTRSVVKCNAIPVLINSLWLTTSKNVQTNSLWALGNIASECAQYRDDILFNNILNHLHTLFNSKTNLNLNNTNDLKLLTNATRTLCNLCSSKPKPNWKYIKIELELLTHILFNYVNAEIYQHICWAFNCLVDCNDENDPCFQYISSKKILSKLIGLMDYKLHDEIIEPILLILGHITSKNEKYTQLIIDCNILFKCQELYAFFRINSKIIRCLCFVISNIAAGTEEQIQMILENDLFVFLINIINAQQFKYSIETKTEAIYAICNATFNANTSQIQYLIHINIIPTICYVLKKIYKKIYAKISIEYLLLIILKAIQNILDSNI
eukprot:229113_1